MTTIRLPAIVNSTIVKVRAMTKKEAETEYWEGHVGRTIVIELDNGMILYASSDPEGNGPGCMYGSYEGDGFYVMEEK